MTEMLDKIRKELHEQAGYTTSWETCSQCEDAARAVLAILRNPTDLMKDAGASVGPDTPNGQFGWNDAEEVYSAMIDAALK